MRARPLPLAVVTILATVAVSCGGDDTGSGDTAPSPTESVTSLPASTSPDTTAPVTTAATVASTTAPSTSPPAVPPTVATTVPPGPSIGELEAAVTSALRTDAGEVPLADRMAELSVPGVAVVVVRDGEVVGSFAAGTTPVGAPMTPATVTQVGSISKPVAAAGALAMVARGELPFDVDVTTVLRSYVLPPGQQSPADPVTIERLLSHTAGTNVDGFFGYGTPAEAPTLPEVLAGNGNTPAIEVVARPGEGFEYSGGGYELMEQAMLDASGAASFDDLMSELVLDPAGMVDSRYALELPADVAARTTVGSIDGEPLGNGWQTHPEHAAAGLWTTVDDLGRFLAALTRSFAGADGLLPPVQAQQMITPAADAGNSRQVGHGLFLTAGGAEFWHNGRNIGYCAEIAGTVDGRHAVAVVTNSFPGGTPLASEIVDTIAHAAGWR